MVLRIADAWTSADPAGSWPIAGEPLFAQPDAYSALLNDLHRYLREEITGRSYLIAGHRGSGKTAMVLHAVRRIRNAALQQSVTPKNSDLAGVTDPQIALFGRRQRPQRPLIVKIVGQSLIAPPPLLTFDEVRKQEEAAAKVLAANAKHHPVKTGADPALAANALVHITIALYRALASEVATAAALHARGEPGPLALRRSEVAAQLALSLDAEPDAGQLRRYWKMLGRLEQGLLWPAEAFRTGADFSKRDATVRQQMSDQGFREIVAITTAAQAFQICAGKITYSRVDNDSAAKEASLTVSGNIADLVRYVTSLLAGVATGAAVVVNAPTQAPLAIGVGLLTWVLGTASFNVTGNRSRKRSQTFDFNFLRDRSVQTLDRELPVVIDRIRDAGLAPVFVIDELDKMANAQEVVAAIIDRLKHLIADHGFFCFLTDRSYYELISRKVSDEVYPTEHTYFSRRLLVTQRPTDLTAYLRGLLASDAPDQDRVPLNMFALVVAYRSKMNFADVGRAVDYFMTADPSGATVLKGGMEEALRARRDLRMAATMQIAIEQVVSTSLFEEALQDDPDSAFVQLAIDALYIIPRAWERPDQSEVHINEASIKIALQARMVGSTTGLAEISIDAEDLRVITRMVRLQATFLKNFGKLRKSITARRSELAQTYLSIVFEENQVGAAGLLSEKDPDTFTFVLDTKGILIPDPNALPIDEEQRMAIIRELRPIASAFLALLLENGLDIEALRAIGLLPDKFSTGLIRETIQTLQVAEQAWTPSVSMQQAEDIARMLVVDIEHNGAWLEAVLIAFARLKHDVSILSVTIARQRGNDAKLSPPPPALLQALARYVPVPTNNILGPVPAALIGLRGTNAPQHQPPTPNAAGLNELCDKLKMYRSAIAGTRKR